MSTGASKKQDRWTTDLKVGERTVCSLLPPARKAVLWHVAAGCNISCDYCYGTFNGSSYKKSFKKKTVAQLPEMLDAATDLAASGFTRAHVCGGEPFLFRDLWRFLEGLSDRGIERYVLTNGTFLPRGFEEALSRGLFTNLSFSLDSHIAAVNDQVRERTSDVLRTIRHVIETRQRLGATFDIGLYAVLTRVNLDGVAGLLEVAKQWGFSFATVQICYLPASHPKNDSLGLRACDREAVLGVLESLRNLESATFRIPGFPFFALSEAVTGGEKLTAVDCFADRGQFLFIDAEGNVRPCATRGDESVIGNIRDRRLREFIGLADRGPAVCRDVCADCLGAWEMAHPRRQLGHSAASPLPSAADQDDRHRIG